MKTEDFERLKQICEKEGFIINEQSHWCGTYRITIKDPWEGVEFAEDKQGIIWPIRNYGFDKSIYKPSTETAYVEQLKRICFNKFPKINKGDKFLINGAVNVVPNHCGKSNYIDYDKESDSLFYQGVLIYKQGKWAERVKERVKVYNEDWYLANNEYRNFVFKCDISDLSKVKKDIGKFLSKQLENYLNDEKGN